MKQSYIMSLVETCTQVLKDILINVIVSMTAFYFFDMPFPTIIFFFGVSQILNFIKTFCIRRLGDKYDIPPLHETNIMVGTDILLIVVYIIWANISFHVQLKYAFALFFEGQVLNYLLTYFCRYFYAQK